MRGTNSAIPNPGHHASALARTIALSPECEPGCVSVSRLNLGRGDLGNLSGIVGGCITNRTRHNQRSVVANHPRLEPLRTGRPLGSMGVPDTRGL